jgi:hypothetical protein
MEQSTKDVEPPQQPAAKNSPTVAVPPQLPASTFTKVDNNLTGIGFFTASSKRSRKAVEKNTIVVDQGVERHISILPSAKYGLPITQDQDFWLALMHLVEHRRRQEGKITNPFSFTTAELIKILGQSDAGRNYKAVQEWLEVIWLTGVRGGVYNTAKKQWLTDRVHVLERAVSVGRELPDSTIADKNYIWFSQWQLDNINAGNLMSIELTTYIELENNIAKNLVPHLQEWLYASQHDGRFEKQYEDICQLLGVRTYRYRSQVDEQFSPSLDELTAHGYLSKWAIEPMANNRKAYKLVLWHGPKFHSDRQARLEKKSRLGLSTTGDTAARPRQRRLKLSTVSETPAIPSGIINYSIVSELGKRGVGEIDARKVLVGLKPGQPVLDQLEWGDTQIQQAKGTRKEITNPPGFYISLLQRDVPLPSTFESSATRNARQKAEFEKSQALQQQAEAAKQAEEADRLVADAQIAALPKAAQAALLKQAKAGLLAQHPNMAHYFKTNPDAEQDGALRARMRNLLREGWTYQSPESHQATNPEVRQATRLQEPAPPPAEQGSPQPVADQPQIATGTAPDVLNLESLLATRQLPPGVDQAAEADRQQYDAFCRQKAEAFIASLDMMERGRRTRAARLFLLNEDPQKAYYHLLVTDGRYDEFHSHSEDRLIAVTIASLGLPDFDAWQASRQGQN